MKNIIGPTENAQLIYYTLKYHPISNETVPVKHAIVRGKILMARLGQALVDDGSSAAHLHTVLKDSKTPGLLRAAPRKIS